MESLEGETLADRLAKGSLPLEQTLRYGVEIADALDKAPPRACVRLCYRLGPYEIGKRPTGQRGPKRWYVLPA